MRRLRRPDYPARLELTPMLDVVFLLLVFFIYAVVMMIRVEVLPLRFTTLASAGPAKQGQFHGITIDGQGGVYFDRQPVTLAQLEARLAAMVQEPGPPKAVLAMEAAGTTDRGPLFVSVMDRIRGAGLDLVIVGQPKPTTAPAPAPP